MRRPKSSKPDTCTERYDVDPTGISGKVRAQYPGRSVGVPCATDIERCRDGLQKSAEAIVGGSTSRRAEHEMPRVGGGISRKPMKAEADREDQAGTAETGRNPGGRWHSRRGGHGDPQADESGGATTSLMEARSRTRQPVARVSAGGREQRRGGGRCNGGGRTQRLT